MTQIFLTVRIFFKLHEPGGGDWCWEEGKRLRLSAAIFVAVIMVTRLCTVSASLTDET